MAPNSVRRPVRITKTFAVPLRSTRRTVFREIFSSRQISLIAFFWTKYARRILAIVSTTSIPISAPDRPSGALWTHTPMGSLLEADHPGSGVLIPRRSTAGYEPER